MNHGANVIGQPSVTFVEHPYKHLTFSVGKKKYGLECNMWSPRYEKKTQHLFNLDIANE